MERYNMETLRKINTQFIDSHVLRDVDLKMANDFVHLIESTRSSDTPKVGDAVEYINEYGEYYEQAHIEDVDEEKGEIYLCEQPYTPFVYKTKDGCGCNTSGGKWNWISKQELMHQGTIPKTFCKFGSCGCCADGTVKFRANVSFWKYTDPRNPNVDEKGNIFTTKNYDRHFVVYDKHKYKYWMDGNGWVTELEYEAWLRTFRGTVFPDSTSSDYKSYRVWTWKWIGHGTLSPEEYDALALPEDTFRMNGDILKCKRLYDDETKIIHIYYVWYWNVPGKAFVEVASEQNEIRRQRYAVPNGVEYQIARSEIQKEKSARHC